MTDRAYPRYAHEAAVSFHLVGQTFEGTTTNVSRGGLCAELAGAIAIGIDLDVDMRLVFDPATRSDPLRLPARVVWCTRVNDAFQVGIAFRPLPAQLAKHLTTFLTYLEGDAQRERSRRESTLDKRFG